ncbi:Panacea domain-containing protein [Candidatus Saccharibacteria bacterium]|nr:Panacea domain-containing protein [Candidatus Saccharibacteria bacterium]
MSGTKKYENLILYICDSLGGSVDGKKKLAKLLYYIDFDRYEYKESMINISGDTYKAWKMGPVPDKYMNIVSKLVKSGKLKHTTRDLVCYYHKQEIFTSTVKPDVSQFDKDDIVVIDRVIKKYGGLSGKQLETLTHQEAPYLSTDPNEEIAYELSFYRGTDFSDVLAVA